MSHQRVAAKRRLRSVLLTSLLSTGLGFAGEWEIGYEKGSPVASKSAPSPLAPASLPRELASPQQEKSAPAQDSGKKQNEQGKQDSSSSNRTGQKAQVPDLDLEQLTSQPVRPAETAAAAAPSRSSSSPTATGSTIAPAATDFGTPSTAGELLERAASVSVRRTSAINLDPRIRGLHSSQLNASANGMTQLKTRVDIDSIFSQIDPANVENIEVVNGPYTSLYGPGFGFLIGELHEAPRYLCGPEHHGLFTTTFETNGNEGYGRARLWGGGRDWGYNVGYSYRAGNDYGTGGDPSAMIPSTFHKDDIYVSASKDLNCSTRIEFDYLRANVYDLELPGIAYDIDRQRTDQFNFKLIGQEDREGPQQFIVQVWKQRTPFNGTSTRPSKQSSFFDVLLEQPNPTFLAGGRVDAAGLAESVGFRALRTFGDKDSTQLTVGVDWRRSELQYRELDFDVNGDLTFGANVFGIPDSSQEDIGLLTHLKIPFNERFSVNIGGRVDRVYSDVTPDLVTAQAPLDPAGFYRPGFSSSTNTLLMGYLSSDYQATDILRFHSGVSYAMRNPNLTELYADEPWVPVARFGNSFADGNSDLEPEHNLQFDLGLTAEWDKLQLGVNVFQSTIWNYILATPSTFSTFVPAGINGPTNLRRDYTAFGFDPANPAFNGNASTASLAYRYTNIDRADLYGGEAFMKWSIRSGLDLHSDLGYVKGTNHNPVFFDDAARQVVQFKSAEALPGIGPLSSTMTLRWFDPVKDRWSLAFQTRMVQGQDFVADSLGELSTPGFTIFNLHGSYEIRQGLRVFGSIHNLLDRSYTEHGSLVISNPSGQLEFVREKGRSFLVGCEVRY